MQLNVDGDGFLLDRDEWSEEIAKELAEADGMELTDHIMNFINEARRMYEDSGVVPPIRKFAKHIDEDQKALFAAWMTGPMKPITKYGGLPKPTGCV